MKFRLAKPEDAARLLEIYGPYVEKTSITFEYDLPSLADFRARIKEITENFPYIVAIVEDNIVGYAYAARYRERKAYDWAVELSIYVDEDFHGHHVGRELYHRLFALLKKQNYHRVYACITTPNPRSVRFHEKVGFKKVGIMEKAGYKLNHWYGIEWMDLSLQGTDEVLPVRKIGDLSAEEVKEILG